MSSRDFRVHPFYEHTEPAFELLPAAIQSLTSLKEAFASVNEDFLAIELRTMLERLSEIHQLLADGPQG
ncbi:hypothetical protein ACFPYJ_05070 [Paenibacillus solisilvae]|uniref:Uncharacterized protein n=1 Tax=Paenibacillus solisilvae TaxID=2486751 RepID=A0ABW0VVE1_9BACL